MLTKQEFIEAVGDMCNRYQSTGMEDSEFVAHIFGLVEHLGVSEYWKQQREGDGFAIQ